MPFKIIRNDITKVKADAIVNTANPQPTYAAGTDAAVYKAAGEEDLLRERKKIGVIKRGEVAVTSGFALPAKYIIHTVGPAWSGGSHGEFKTLALCYDNSLKMAECLGCDSIAFPLISTGVYGFPKDKALDIATTRIEEFLKNSEMTVTLVVFDRKAFELSGGLSEGVDAYIDENYVTDRQMFEYNAPERIERSRRREEIRQDETPKWNPALNEVVDNPGKSFQDRLFELIDESGHTDVEVYKKANISRKVFSSMHKPDYHPKKSTVIAMAMALELSLDETNDLLKRAGFALSPSNIGDLIVSYFISSGNYNMFDLNEALFAHGQPTIGC